MFPNWALSSWVTESGSFSQFLSGWKRLWPFRKWSGLLCCAMLHLFLELSVVLSFLDRVNECRSIICGRSAQGLIDYSTIPKSGQIFRDGRLDLNGLAVVWLVGLSHSAKWRNIRKVENSIIRQISFKSLYIWSCKLVVDRHFSNEVWGKSKANELALLRKILCRLFLQLCVPSSKPRRSRFSRPPRHSIEIKTPSVGNSYYLWIYTYLPSVLVGI